MARDAQSDLAGVEAWLEEAWGHLPPIQKPPRVVWNRHGLSAVFERLEVLKDEAAMWDALVSEAAMWLAIAKGWKMETGWAVEDRVAAAMGDGNRRAAGLVSQGMAYEERRLTYQTAAIDQVLWARRWEKATEGVSAVLDEARNRHFANRAERNDLHAQTRLIQVAIEIGEM